MTLSRDASAAGTLELQTNERGFSESDIRAIARMSMSSKTERDDAIGSKGIGACVCVDAGNFVVCDACARAFCVVACLCLCHGDLNTPSNFCPLFNHVMMLFVLSGKKSRETGVDGAFESCRIQVGVRYCGARRNPFAARTHRVQHSNARTAWDAVPGHRGRGICSRHAHALPAQARRVQVSMPRLAALVVYRGLLIIYIATGM